MKARSRTPPGRPRLVFLLVNACRMLIEHARTLVLRRQARLSVPTDAAMTQPPQTEDGTPIFESGAILLYVADKCALRSCHSLCGRLITV